jgi:T5SS/PEP-CTERM-associated repeat protein
MQDLTSSWKALDNKAMNKRSQINTMKRPCFTPGCAVVMALTAVIFTLACGSHGLADVTISGSILDDGTHVYVGYDSDGTLTIDAGSLFNKTSGYLGYNSNCTGTATVTGTGSMLTSSGLNIGENGNGTLNVQDGGQITNFVAYIGHLSGSTGNVIVTGTGSKWTNSNALSIGYSGSGTLNVQDGGQVSNSTGYVGQYSGSQNTVTVSGMGSKWTNSSSLYVGNNGYGTLNIQDGGQVSNTAGYLGYYAGFTGTARVSGMDSKWTNSTTLYVGYKGSGTMTVDDGGLVTANTLYASKNDLYGDGTITVKSSVLDADIVFDGTHGVAQSLDFGTGGTLNLNVDGTGELGAGYKETGTLQIADGLIVSSINGYLGYWASASGSARVAGLSSTWTVNDTLYVGHYGRGTLTVADGGLVTAKTLFASSSDLFGNGTITVKSLILDADLVFDGTRGLTQSLPFGTGGTLNLKINGSGPLGTGYKETGTLRIADGLTIYSSIGYLGFYSGSSGSATVTGTGTKWTISSMLYTGIYGSSTLHIQGGGQVSNMPGYIGYFSGSTGTVIVTGTGSKWTNSDDLYIGYSGIGRMSIEAGGQVSDTYGTLGNNSGSTGTVMVTGPGSKWINSEEIYVGFFAGSGKLVITNGGKVTAKTLYLDKPRSAISMHVSGNDMLVLGDASFTGKFVHKSQINLYADAFLPSAIYKPISDFAGRMVIWSGTGSSNAFGGTWDNAAKTFVVSAPTTMSAGDIDTVSNAERLLITEPISGKRTGASFGVVVGTPTFSATWMTTGELSTLAATLGFEGSVLAAWDYTTILTGSEVMLSFDIGLGWTDPKIWHLSSGSWSLITPDLETYDSHGILSFTTTEFSGFAVAAVPEPATLALLLSGAVVLLALGVRGSWKVRSTEVVVKNATRCIWSPIHRRPRLPPRCPQRRWPARIVATTSIIAAKGIPWVKGILARGARG